MRRFLLTIVASLAFSTSAHAEKLEFDHRLYPPLKEVLDSGEKDMLLFDDRNPARLVDLIAIRGKSAQNWTEALEIVALVPPREVKKAREWFDIIRAQADRRCPNTITIIAEDDASITFERSSPDCPAERAQTGIYRLVTGQRSWFQLTVLSKNALEPAAREQWLALLASARLN